MCISIHAPTRGATQACLSGITMYVISIHAPTRGATLHYSIDIKTIIFQSTLPREERRKCSTINAISTYFNPRSHERSDNFQFSGNQSPDCISIHAPTRGATKRCWIECWCYSNFNPRSHERSDDNFILIYRCISISIHAPTRGATIYAQILSISKLFQSTLPREERLVSSSFVTVSIYFNPRSHERSDSVAQGTLHPHKDFNPRSHERSDCQLLLQAQIQFLFQSTLPREERQGLANRQGNTGGDFNPRSHERSDKNTQNARVSYRISIHAPTRGATELAKNLRHTLIISIHAPTRGATAILHKKFVYFYTIPTINI